MRYFPCVAITVLLMLSLPTAACKLGGDLEDFIEDGLSMIELSSSVCTQGGDEVSYVASLSKATVTLSVSNPRALKVRYTLRWDAAYDTCFLNAPDDVDTSVTGVQIANTNSGTVSFSFTLAEEAEWKHIPLILSMYAAGAEKTYEEQTITVACDSPPGEVGEIAAGRDFGKRGYVAFTLPAAARDADLARVRIEWTDVTKGTSRSRTLEIGDSNLMSAYSPDCLSSSSGGEKRYFMSDGTVAGDIYAFTVTLIDAVGQESASVTASTDAVVTLSYDANGGSGAPPAVIYEIGATDTVGSSLSRPNYTFIEWNTKADGTGTSYAAGDTITLGSSNVTLYAQWSWGDLDELAAAGDTAEVSASGVSDGSYTQATSTSDNGFVHNISAFTMGTYETTYELWYTVFQWALRHGYSFANAGAEGSDGTAGAEPTGAMRDPVTCVSWRDAIVWCNAYSEMAGYTPCYYVDSLYATPLRASSSSSSFDSTAGSEDNPYVKWSADGYRLPTFGEWQYAASCAATYSYNYASGASADYSDTTADGEVAWYCDNSSSTTQTVGTKAGNLWGLYDLSGNVWEWCWDLHGDSPTVEMTDYRGPDSDSGISRRDYRGGSAWDVASYLQIGSGSHGNPWKGAGDLGFRVCRTR